MKLFTRTKIGNMTLKNRIIMCPMGNKTDPDGGVQERNIDYFEERAKGGCAAIFTGAFMCTEEFETRGCNVLYNFSHVDRLNLLVDKVHAHDCKLVVQLTAGLGRMGYTDPTRPPYSASDTETFYFKGVYCKPFTVEQIRYMVKAMGNSAMLAKRAGADAVELHCYGGCPISSCPPGPTTGRTSTAVAWRTGCASPWRLSRRSRRPVVPTSQSS